jgi:alanine racemase
MRCQRAYSTWVEVDLGAIEDNLRYFLTETRREVMAVVKANAYGHGAVQVARRALRSGATWLAVARIEEALELREAGLQAPVLLLGHAPPGRLQQMIEAGIALTVWGVRQIEAASQAAVRAGGDARLHLKVDTGMSRLGVQAGRALSLARRIAELPGAELEGVFTHLACADEADPSPTDAQLRLFEEVLQSLTDAGLRPPVVHSANSAASLTRPDAWYDLVRVGIAMYGLHPSAQCRLPEGLRPALTWKSTLTQVKTLPVGRGVSYGHIYRTEGEERVGTIPVGYADGYRRIGNNEVLVRGVKVPVIGRVTMDQIMVNLDAVPGAGSDDEVVLLGGQNGARIAAEEIAERWGTINYEVVSGIAARVPRVYL